MTSTTIKDAIIHSATITRDYETLNTDKLMLKMMEELGELAECILVEQGDLTHKTLKETSYGEAADVMICLMCVLVKHNPDTTVDDIIEELANQIFTKCDKYESILHSRITK